MKEARSRHILYQLRRRVGRLDFSARSLSEGVIIGIIAATASIAFLAALQYATVHLMGGLAGYPVTEPMGEPVFVEAEDAGVPNRLWMVLLPALGGLASGLLVYNFAREAEGHGTDAMIKAFHVEGGAMRARVPFVKALATICILGTGGSAGREGPVIQMGAGFGSVMGKFLKLSVRRRRLLLLAGAAGGLGAIFRSPLGGAITSIEILYKEDFETEGLISCVVASVTGYALFSQFTGIHSPIFGVNPAMNFIDARELFFFLILGMICALAGAVFIAIFRAIRTIFARSGLPPWLRPALGGLLVGIVGLAVPESVGTGWGVLQDVLLNQEIENSAGVVSLAKMLTSSLSVGSGGSGGIFGPSLFVGGMLGGAVGDFFHALAPGIVRYPEAYAILGMAAFFAGVANAPIGSLIMVAEMTGAFSLTAPLMFACVTSALFSKGSSIYDSQVGSKFHSPAHRRDMIIDVMSETRIGEIEQHLRGDLHLVERGASMAHLSQLVENEDWDYFIVGSEDEIHGVIEPETLNAALASSGAAESLVAEDLASPVPILTTDETLRTALDQFVATDVDHILVRDSQDPSAHLRLLSRQELEKAYVRLT